MVVVTIIIVVAAYTENSSTLMGCPRRGGETGRQQRRVLCYHHRSKVKLSEAIIMRPGTTLDGCRRFLGALLGLETKFELVHVERWWGFSSNFMPILLSKNDNFKFAIA